MHNRHERVDAHHGPPAGVWIFVDRGGTFTDVIAQTPDGELHVRKVLSDVPGREKTGIAAAIEVLLQDLRTEPSAVHIGTTVATNALLTRSGAPTALVLTQGLGDLAWIGDQTRPALFKLPVVRQRVLHHTCIEAQGRLAEDGSELVPLDEAAIVRDLKAARIEGCTAVAICLLHGWRHASHERRVAALAVEAGFARNHVVCSRDLPIEGYLPRVQTLTVDASLTPILHDSLHDVRAALPDVPLACMHSGGGLVDIDAFRGPQAVLSGPAGGVVAAARVAQRAQCTRAVSLDMGGTSTDVAWWDGALQRQSETRIAGVTLAVPALQVETIAAGGGSICTFDGVRLRVGPESAGANPGPACYRRGGGATLTDCLVVLDRLPAHVLPHVFGPQCTEPADAHASHAVLEELHERMQRADVALQSVCALAQSFVDIAVDAMASAVRRISTEQGRSLDGAALVAFGGAGGLLACAVAEALDMDTVLLHPLAGVLSAWGMGQARQRSLQRATLNIALDAPQACEQANARLDLLQQALQPGPEDQCVRSVELAVPDWDRSIAVSADLLDQPATARHVFAERCRERYGWDPLDIVPVISSVEVECIGPAAVHHGTSPRSTLHVGETLEGPQVVVEQGSTAHVDDGWRGLVQDDGTLRLTQVQDGPPALARSDVAGAALFAARMQAIAEEMGALLRFTARSVNMRERLDYSCAIFTPTGELIANGPHMPVHLGSMGDSVRHVLEVRSSALGEGDAVLLNDPFHGGTHLPDLTVVSGVFHDGELIAMVASRGHHSDVGSTTPGSMPPDATSLQEEGVVVDDLLLLDKGVLQTAALMEAMSAGPWPCRAPDRVLDDLRAQLAANQRGMRAMKRLAGELGTSRLYAGMETLLQQGDHLVRRCLKQVQPGAARMELDDGGCIAVAITPDGDTLHVDFTGTREQFQDNRNAPPAVTRAALLYVLRCLVGQSIPLNDGCLRPVQLTLPEGSLLSPRPGAAVAGGNVETSQQVVDALLAAFGLQAASQGTMNNFAFGDQHVQHYETICGGTGAGPNFDGGDCVQGHMTNSRLTDPEILERRFPVRLWRLQRRVGSGGTGHHRGGDGVVREIELTAPVSVSLLSSRRVVAPPGAEGGEEGTCGAQRLVRDGITTELSGGFVVEGRSGDRIIIETPGGGGWGRP